MSIVVVLPAPLGPSRAAISPSFSPRSMPSTARTEPKLRCTPRRSTAATACAPSTGPVYRSLAIGRQFGLSREPRAPLPRPSRPSSAAGASGCPAASTAFATAPRLPQTGASPMPLAPNGPVRRRDLDEDRLDRGDLFRRWDRVVHERAGEASGRRRTDALEERPAEALRRAATHLALDECGVEGAADVLGDDVARGSSPRPSPGPPERERGGRS